MGSSERTCVKCKKAIKSTEIDLVCGLWCRKSFHNECLGLSNSEARAATCSKVRFKFHCEACEERLGFELFGDRETHEPKNLENCVNNCANLLELVQKLVKLTNELSNDNLTLHSKLDTVLNSTARLEEYLLPSPRRFENVCEETFANNVEHVTGNSTKRMTETREQKEYTNSNNQSVNHKQMRYESELQRTDDMSLQHIASDFPEHSRLQENTAEGCSSNEWEMPDGHASSYDRISIEKERLQEWEEPGGHNSTQGALSIVKEECASSEDFLMPNTFSTEGTENEEDEENTVIEDAGEELSSSEDFLRPSTLVIKKTENEDDEVVVMEDDFEELQHEVESTACGEPESYVRVGVEDDKINDDSGCSVTLLAARTDRRIQCTIKQGPMCGNEIGTRNLAHRCNICKKTFSQMQDLKEHTHMNRCELLHSCSTCHKTFTTRGSLKRHFRLHTGERPYSCSICNKTFVQRIHLKLHLQRHSGELPYSCGVCSTRFILKSDLKRHLMLHTGERPYSCGVCNKKFIRNYHLKCHSRVHTGESRTAVRCVIRD